MPNLSALTNLRLPLGGRRGADVVGLDIQPGYVAAVQAHVNGGIVVERAAGAPLPPDTVREGEVFDERGLGEALQELFQDAGLGKRVRVGLANQRTVLRTLDLPPVTDRKELAAAVRFQAEDQVPMPLASAVLDFHSLGVFDTPAGPRQRVIVVAAQREMVERLLRAVRYAGLRAEGVDLSAFALIRSLYRPGPAPAAAHGADGEGANGPVQQERVLYLNVGGLTNMAIAEGTLCRFTRVVGGGLEAMASEIAERGGIPLVEARALLAAFELNKPAPAVLPEPAPSAPEPPAIDADGSEVGQLEREPSGDPDEGSPPQEAERVETWALAQGAAAPPAQEPAERPETAPPSSTAVHRLEAEVRLVLENGIREIVGEVRNSLDFHRSQEGGGEVQSVVLSGPALELRGFSEALEADLGIAVRREAVHFAGGQNLNGISAHRLAIATGLATEEAPR
ncbi:MAG: pilus assembly protein PilM [Solirubrobacterales bacterium]